MIDEGASEGGELHGVSEHDELRVRVRVVTCMASVNMTSSSMLSSGEE